MRQKGRVQTFLSSFKREFAGRVEVVLYEIWAIEINGALYNDNNLKRENKIKKKSEEEK